MSKNLEIIRDLIMEPQCPGGEPPPLPPKTRRSPMASSAITGSSHVVKIRINPEAASTGTLHTIAEVRLDDLQPSPCIRINVNGDGEMVQNVGVSGAFFYYGSVMSSGQVSPSDTLDSGTCSDMDVSPLALPAKRSQTGGVSVTLISGQHKRAPSLTSSGADADSDDNASSISCDSLNASESKPDDSKTSAFLPHGLLQDIRERSLKLAPSTGSQREDDVITNNSQTIENAAVGDREARIRDQGLKVIVEECTYEERRRQSAPIPQVARMVKHSGYETDKFINFHLNEKCEDIEKAQVDSEVNEDDSFVGYKDLLGMEDSATIRSAKGTIRGVKNRVRAGIATFLSINDHKKTYKERDGGKVVVYTTTMGIVRDTYHACMKVKQILRTQLARFEERDIFMSSDYQVEVRERMRSDRILVPQVFVDGQHIGDVETVEKLNESGELRRILKPYKSMDACSTCQVCGGYNLLPCPVCNGSKKSVHRNHFTAEFVALKCMNCDEVGLVKCSSCAF